jgi:hypothetical protein
LSINSKIVYEKVDFIGYFTSKYTNV